MKLEELNLTEEQLANVTKYTQSECDKIRTDYSQRLKLVNDELTKYKPVEKSETEKALEERLKALEEKEQQLLSKEQNFQIKNKFEEMGLPVGLVDYLKIGSVEDVEKVGGELANYFLENGNRPTNHSKTQGVTKEQFKAMSYGERAKLYSENPDLYKMLSK